MSYVPGGALDKWLYGISDEEHKTVDISLLVQGGLPGGQQGLWMLNDAGSTVRDLLTQLAGVFGSFQPIAFHRDVSSHNVLVDFARGLRRPEFALIDFGLAVRSGSWSREWRNSNLAGDPRYWTPSAWMAFAFGFKYVATHPNAGFQHQYLVRMDHFSLGVLGLETLLALWDPAEAREGSCVGMPEVRAAWGKYWAAVIHLFQMFHMQGAQEVRQFIAQSQDEGISSLVTHLRQLRHALRAAAAQPANMRVSALLLVLADLVDEKGTVRWAEIPPMLGEDLQASMAEMPEVAEAEPETGMDVGEHPRSAQVLAARHGAAHSRIRSTGEILDQERGSEPEAMEANPPDLLARTQANLHVRRIPGFA
jgi:serine/threonine protein kinase